MAGEACVYPSCWVSAFEPIYESGKHSPYQGDDPGAQHPGMHQVGRKSASLLDQNPSRAVRLALRGMIVDTEVEPMVESLFDDPSMIEFRRFHQLRSQR